jgi:hypothetical protein
LPVFLFGQETKTTFKDFNNDSVIDRLESYYDGGSGFGGTYVTAINGKTKEQFELNNFGCFCDIKQVILVPPELRKESNKPFLNAIVKELLPDKRKEPESSLQWIISANDNHKVLSKNAFYDLIINSPTKWISGNIKLPDAYYVEISGNTLHKLYTTSTESKLPKWYDKEKNKGFIVYYAFNHYRNEKGDSLTMVYSTPLYKAYRTSHGVVITKGDSYTWIFVTDYPLTGGPAKLRWESIGNVQIIDKYAIVQQQSINDIQNNNFFIIDIENGTVGRLKLDLSGFGKFEVNTEYLIIKDDFRSYPFELAKLFNELGQNTN